jgi:general stress protein 26
MADTDRTTEDAKGQLFDQLEAVKAGMLMVEGSAHHSQPMHPYIDREQGLIWFLTSDDTELVSDVGGGGKAHYTLIGKKDDYYACMRGRIERVHDEQKIDEVWNAVAAAWFEGGRDNPHITLLCLRLEDAAIWSTSGNPITFALEIAKANMREEKLPDVGERVEVHWR